jgi:hypothetical protein
MTEYIDHNGNEFIVGQFVLYRSKVSELSYLGLVTALKPGWYSNGQTTLGLNIKFRNPEDEQGWYPITDNITALTDEEAILWVLKA